MTPNDTADDKPITKDENLNDIPNDKADKENKGKKSFFKKDKKPHTFDNNETIDCISKVIGSYGPWQKKFVIFYMIIYLISPFQNYGIVFYAAKSDFWCADDSFKVK